LLFVRNCVQLFKKRNIYSWFPLFKNFKFLEEGGGGVTIPWFKLFLIIKSMIFALFCVTRKLLQVIVVIKGIKGHSHGKVCEIISFKTIQGGPLNRGKNVAEPPPPHVWGCEVRNYYYLIGWDPSAGKRIGGAVGGGLITV
jgi:hypothetical protein